MSDKKQNKLSAADFVRKIKSQKESSEGFDYRQAAFKLFEHVCAKCGRDFDGKDLSQLTVHHKDSDHFNNPRDGSNWELLCLYCHEDEHARAVLADQIAPAKSNTREVTGSNEAMLSLGDKLKAALNKK